MLLLAHLSDPHLPPMPRPRLAELAGKRLAGFTNWQLFRRPWHRPEILQAIMQDVKACAPDHIALTGDLINIALAAEFPPGRAFLERLGTPDHVSFIPGNHDIYVRETAGHAAAAWGEYMTGDDGARGFPYLRRRGPVALIGLSTGLPTPLLMASGELGAQQCDRLAALLRQCKGTFRVVLIHHPPLGPRPHHKRLVDAEAFLEVLKQHGAELVLHGHDHVNMLNLADTVDGPVPLIGVASCSVAPGAREDDPATYNLFSIDRESDGWRCEMVSRGIGPDGSIVEIARRILK